jgi:hypothetical protein
VIVHIRIICHIQNTFVPLLSRTILKEDKAIICLKLLIAVINKKSRHQEINKERHYNENCFLHLDHSALLSRVRRHFCFEAKWSETERNLFRFNVKKCFFCLFRIDTNRRNLKRNKNKTKRKQNEKEAKTALIFFASKRSEEKRKRNFFRFDVKKVFFACFRLWSETKIQWSKNKTKKEQKLQSEKG